MKKKVLVLVAALLCVVMVLAACSNTAKFDDALALNAYVDENPTYAKAENVTVAGEAEGAEGQLVLLENENDNGRTVYSVYNVDTNATVFTVTESETVTGDTTVYVAYEIEFKEVWDDHVIFAVYTYTETQTPTDVTEKCSVAFYDAKGVQFANFEDVKGELNIRTTMDIIRIDNKLYRVAVDGSVAAVRDIAYYAELPTLQAKVGDYYYAYADINAKSSIYVYNASLLLVQQYQVPSYASGSVWILNNGNLLIQYRYVTDFLADEDDYDVVANGGKYVLESYVLNVKNGKLKEADLEDWYVTDVTARDVVWYNDPEAGWDTDGFNADIENIAVASPIKDKLLDTAETAKKHVILSKKGKPGDVIDGYIAGMDASTLVMLTTNRFAVKNYAGKWYLLNEEGNNLGEIPNPATLVKNEKYMVIGDRIYDYNLAMLYDVSELENQTVLAHGILYTNVDGEQLLFADGQMKTIINKDAKATHTLVRVVTDGDNSNYEYSDRVFLVMKVVDGATTYDIYNDVGAVLMNTDATMMMDPVYMPMAMGIETENAILLAGFKMAQSEMEYVYIRLCVA